MGNTKDRETEIQDQFDALVRSISETGVKSPVFVRPKERPKRYLVIGRMLAGWHAATENESASGGSLESFLSEAHDGAVIYDGSRCDPSLVMQMVMSGPMLRITLYGAKRFADHETAFRMLPGLSGGFDTAVAYAITQGVSKDDIYHSLDYVGWHIYRGLLGKLAGIRFGRVANGRIVWEIGG